MPQNQRHATNVEMKGTSPVIVLRLLLPVAQAVAGVALAEPHMVAAVTATVAGPAENATAVGVRATSRGTVRPAAVVAAALAAASIVAAVVRPAILAVELDICHVIALRVESRNATTVVNKVIFPGIAHPSPPLSASATNASNQGTCSLLARTKWHVRVALTKQP